MQSPEKGSESWDSDWTCCPRLDEFGTLFSNCKRAPGPEIPESDLPLKNKDSLPPPEMMLNSSCNINNNINNNNNNKDENCTNSASKRPSKVDLSSVSSSRRDSFQATSIASLTNLVKDLFRNEPHHPSSSSTSTSTSRANCISIINDKKHHHKPDHVTHTPYSDSDSKLEFKDNQLNSDICSESVDKCQADNDPVSP